LYEEIEMTTEPDQRAPEPSGETLHMVPEPYWERHQGAETYLPEHYDRDGFIHCTDGEANLLEVANLFYRDDPRPFLVLTLDVGRLASPVRYDDPAARYPHIYGPLNTDAVIAVRRAVRQDDGAFVAFA
jgi:uncharacterized protein (DUF952 family)